MGVIKRSLLIGYILISYVQIHTVLAYPIYFLLFFFIFLTLKNYVIGVIFITIIVLWSSVFIEPGLVSTEHIAYDRIINTVIAAIICICSELFFKAYQYSERFISEYAKALHQDYLNYAIQCFEIVLTGNTFNRQEQIRKMRTNDAELKRLLQWVPYSFSKVFSSKSKQYEIATQELENIRTQILTIEYIARHYPSELNNFYLKNRYRLLKIYILLQDKKQNHTKLVKKTLATLIANHKIEEPNLIDKLLLNALKSLTFPHRAIFFRL